MTAPPPQVLELPGARVLALSGDVDVSVAPNVVAQLPQLLDGAPAVVLDLTAVTFFDSSGVRLVDRVARTCRQHGLSWRVVAPVGSSSRRLLELVGMAGREVVDDRAAAVAELSG